jgi:hypothetical protein
LWWRKFFLWEPWVKSAKSSFFTIPEFVLWLLYSTRWRFMNWIKSVHLKAFSLKISFRGYVSASSIEGKVVVYEYKNWLSWFQKSP